MPQDSDRSRPIGQLREMATMAPGDEAPPGTPGTGEDVCPSCGGNEDHDCDRCLGKGRVTKAISAGP